MSTNGLSTAFFGSICTFHSKSIRPIMSPVSLLILSLLAGCNVCTYVNGQESFDLSPNISLSWDWEFQFKYPLGNDTEAMFEYTFCPKSSVFELKDAGENDTLLLKITPSLMDSLLSHCTLTILITQNEGYFAWTNMTLDYKFSNTVTKNATLTNISNVLLSEQSVQSSPHEKFLTSVNDVYECLSRIPIPFEKHVAITFQNMTFQAFKAVPNPVNKSAEVCPRDFKTNIPITALTGSSLLVIVTVIVGAFGIKLILNHQKRKES
ncbi:unnamed protein product [Dicrocoelium dendriticum]|nr:unnamed protein product [Dicrocoelium dendriticum]